MPIQVSLHNAMLSLIIGAVAADEGTHENKNRALECQCEQGKLLLAEATVPTTLWALGL